MQKEIESRIRYWQNLANSFPDMRYPLYNISVNSILSTAVHPFTSSVKMKLETFVQNEGGTRIVLVSDTHEYFGQYKPEMLESFSKRFIDRCKLVKEKHIFNARHSIREPFNFNK